MSEPEVTVEEGRLRGSVKYNILNECYYSFQGIPYAKPPVGELRFKAPVPSEKWSGIFDATKEGSPCYARDFFKQGAILGSENCLVLNVYTKELPDVESKTVKPVMFWIHGGGFVSGSSSTELYSPDFLITEDVVIVSVNYRLGMLGFLCMEDTSLGIPGNAGLKDIVMALKWVKKNIVHFNGDPNNVTIFGQSAGGAAVHLLVLSPIGKGLFDKAIAQSGCAINPWSRGCPGAQRVASAMGLDRADDETVYKHLMKKSVEEILEIQEQIEDICVANKVRPFGFVIEKQKDENAFLTEEPIDIMMSGKFNQVPFMIGYTTAEGMLVELVKSPKYPKGPSCEEAIPWYFGYQPDSIDSKAVAEKIKNFYYGSEEPSAKNVGKTYTMFSDALFVYGIYVTVMKHLQISQTPIHLYRVSIETELNFFKKMLGIKEPGVSHCDDIGYLFKTFATPDIEHGSIEDTSYRRLVKLWANFATYGNPTPNEDPLLNVSWPPVTNHTLDFLDIGEQLIVTCDPEKDRMNFWEKLFANSPTAQKSK